MHHGRSLVSLSFWIVSASRSRRNLASLDARRSCRPFALFLFGTESATRGSRRARGDAERAVRGPADASESGGAGHVPPLGRDGAESRDRRERGGEAGRRDCADAAAPLAVQGDRWHVPRTGQGPEGRIRRWRRRRRSRRTARREKGSARRLSPVTPAGLLASALEMRGRRWSRLKRVLCLVDGCWVGTCAVGTGRNRRKEDWRHCSGMSAHGWNRRHTCSPACLSRMSSSTCSLSRFSADVRGRCPVGVFSRALGAEPALRTTRSCPYYCARFMCSGHLIATPWMRVHRRPEFPPKRRRRGSFTHASNNTTRCVLCCSLFWRRTCRVTSNVRFTFRSAVRCRVSFARDRYP